MANNNCGSAYTNSLGINVVSGGGGGPQQRIASDGGEQGDPTLGELNTPYPNPANTQIRVIVDKFSTVELIGIEGKIHYETNGVGTISIPTENLTSGLYIVNINSVFEIVRKKVLVFHN